MKSVSFEYVISQKIPENAISYCISVFENYPFKLVLSRNRKSKSGDYRYDKKNNNNISTVTVNSGLNKYSFLITLIHEMAHHTTRLKYIRKTMPHGMEWKREFRDLMLPLLNPLIFPENILKPLAKHMKNPKASTWSDGRLSMVLREYDTHSSMENEGFLDTIPDGDTFSFNDRIFTKLKKRRTRILCQECSTGRKYLIPRQALVKAV